MSRLSKIFERATVAVATLRVVSTRRETIDSILEKMQPLDVSAKPMFGEYGLYHRGKNFALVCDDTLFIKITPPGETLAARVTKRAPYDGAKPAFKISPAKLADRAWLITLVEATSEALPAPKAKKKN